MNIFFISNGQAKKITENYEIYIITVNNTKDRSHCQKSDLDSQYIDYSEEYRRDIHNGADGPCSVLQQNHKVDK